MFTMNKRYNGSPFLEVEVYICDRSATNNSNNISARDIRRQIAKLQCSFGALLVRMPSGYNRRRVVWVQ